jgi:hypothetical protein
MEQMDGVMAKDINSKIDPGQPVAYQTRMKGHLGCQWTDWFGGLAITLEDNGDTLLTGSATDQAALHGLLRKVRDLGRPRSRSPPSHFSKRSRKDEFKPRSRISWF